jgi:hypothetical protein
MRTRFPWSVKHPFLYAARIAPGRYNPIWEENE